MRDRIVLAHGGGGELTDELIRELVLPRLKNPRLDPLGDSAVLSPEPGELALTTDAYVVQPLFFPGGDIGRLAVCGTVNDLAMAGAEPVALTLAMILEEGLAVETLGRVLDSVAAAAKEAGVAVVAGDTKVVERGRADGLYLVTSGVGRRRDAPPLGAGSIRPGDAVLVSGTLGDHGLAVMLARAGMESTLQSDVAPLAGLVGDLLDAAPGVRFLRDPTRGGLAGVVADLARETGLRLTLDEAALPVRAAARSAAELLGLDLLGIANEGNLVAVVAPEDADRALAALRAHPFGARAARVGEIGTEGDGRAELRTRVGGRRLVVKPYGEELPRIC